MGTGKLNRRPTFYNGSYTVDAGGGSTFVETERWEYWAEIKDGSSSSLTAQSQDMITEEYRVKVRFDGRFNSNTWMIYEGQVCKCVSMSVESEGYKNFLNYRFSKTNTWVDLS